MKKLVTFGAVAAVTLCALTTGSGASATPPTGLNPAVPYNTVPVVGTLPAHTRAHQDGISLKVRSETTVRTFTLTYPVGSSSGWHSHPGIVLAVVQQGTVVRQVGCRQEQFTVGQSFTEVAPHEVSNLYLRRDQQGAVDAVLSITQLFPKNAPTARIEQDPPRCS